MSILKIKSSIVKQVSEVKVETVERIKQTSDVIADATSVLSEVTVEAEVSFGINTSERGYFLQRGNKVATYIIIGGAYGGESTRLPPMWPEAPTSGLFVLSR